MKNLITPCHETVARAWYVTFLIVLRSKVIVKNAKLLANRAEVQLRCLDTIGQVLLLKCTGQGVHYKVLSAALL